MSVCKRCTPAGFIIGLTKYIISSLDFLLQYWAKKGLLLCRKPIVGQATNIANPASEDSQTGTRSLSEGGIRIQGPSTSTASILSAVLSLASPAPAEIDPDRERERVPNPHPQRRWGDKFTSWTRSGREGLITRLKANAIQTRQIPAR